MRRARLIGPSAGGWGPHSQIACTKTWVTPGQIFNSSIQTLILTLAESVRIVVPTAGHCGVPHSPRGLLLVHKGGVTPPSFYRPKMVVRKNGFCGRWRFCFTHTAGGNFFV